MKFTVGDKVERYPSDFQLEGEVCAVFTTKHGQVRYVVEHAPDNHHIYTGSQLLPVQPSRRHHDV